MSSPDFGTSPPQYGRIARPRGFLVLNNEQNGSPMATHGHGTLTALIKSRSTSSLTNLHLRRASVLVGRETPDEEDHIARPVREEDLEDFSRNNERRMSVLEVLTGPQMRSQRLLGNSNPRYRWERYWKSDEELKAIKKKTLRQYYERVNSLVQQYIYIDRLLDSSLPHDLLNEYNDASANSGAIAVPPTILEEPRSRPDTADPSSLTITSGTGGTVTPPKKVNRTPRELYKVNGERTPLLSPADSEEDEEMNRKMSEIPGFEDDSVESGDRIVQVAIWVNLAANIILLIGKILVIYLTSSLSVLASLVDAALDFLSTIIVGVTGWMISRQDKYQYPIGRRRLEPIGVLVFSVIMMTSFFQVALQCLSRLNSDDHSIIQLGIPALIIMASTVILKGLCWFWCRLVKNSSVQALAQDAMTDVIFNIFSIIFPLIGFYAKLWWLDGLGGLLLSLYVITNWAGTSAGHIRNLTGAAATPDERNVLLYLTMRFAKTILQIQGLQAYHAGDKLNVEVDIVLDENMSLRDSHDLGESLQYVLESVPTVDRAFVHSDYTGWNLPTHMQQQSE